MNLLLLARCGRVTVQECGEQDPRESSREKRQSPANLHLVSKDRCRGKRHIITRCSRPDAQSSSSVMKVSLPSDSRMFASSRIAVSDSPCELGLSSG